MKYKILLVAMSAALITGCSTAYQAGQTPDDLYYSPAKEGLAREDVRRERNNDRYETYTSSEDDNYLRMRIRNGSRWDTIDDFDYWYNPYNSPYYSYSPYGRFSPYSAFTYNGPVWNTWGWNGYNNFGWNNYGWNNFGWRNNFYGHGVYGYYGGGYYGGGFPGVVIKNPVRPTGTARPSLSGYRNGNYNNNNTRRPFGETLNKVFSPAPSTGYSNANTSSSRSADYSAPSRSYNPPASSSGSSSSGASSSGSSGGGAVPRPPR